MRDPKGWISALILLVLGLHAVPVLSYQGLRQTRWPFLTWAMYAKSRPPGPIQTMKRFVIGTTSSGHQEDVTPGLVGLSKDAFRNGYLNPLYKGDTASAQQLISRLNRGRRDPFVELRTVGEKYTLSGTEVISEELPVFRYRATPSPSR
jgi:hypothetical protein